MNELTDWMQKVADSTLLKEMTIPGTHNSGASRDIAMSQCQEYSIYKQLQGGIRYLDMRCNTSTERFSIFHGSIPQFKTFGGILDDIKKFMKDHPNEAIIMRIKDEGGYTDFFKEAFDKYYKDYNGINWYGLEDHHDAKDFNELTLGDIRGKILVIDNSPNGKGKLKGKFHYNTVFVRKRNMTHTDDDGSDVDTKWAFVLRDLNEAKSKNGSQGIYLNTVAGTTIITSGWTPKKFATGDLTFSTINGINKLIVNHLCKDDNNTGAYGIIPMDFPFHSKSANVVSHLISTNHLHSK